MLARRRTHSWRGLIASLSSRQPAIDVRTLIVQTITSVFQSGGEKLLPDEARGRLSHGLLQLSQEPFIGSHMADEVPELRALVEFARGIGYDGAGDGDDADHDDGDEKSKSAPLETRVDRVKECLAYFDDGAQPVRNLTVASRHHSIACVLIGSSLPLLHQCHCCVIFTKFLSLFSVRPAAFKSYL